MASAPSITAGKKIPDDLGTAVNIVTWFSAIWVMILAPAWLHGQTPHGDKKMMGEYLLNAQGEDVLAGIRKKHGTH